MTLIELKELIIKCWGEDDEDALALATIIKEYTKPEKWRDIVEYDMYFNRYNSPASWEDLADEILSDEAFESDSEYVDTIEKMIHNGDCEALYNSNWRINKERGGAIGFDDSVLAVKQFDIAITETLRRTIPIKAATESEALKIAKQMYDSQEIILDSYDFDEVEFECI